MIKEILEKFKRVIAIMVIGLILCILVFYIIGQLISLKDFKRSADYYLEKNEETIKASETMLNNISEYGIYMNYNLVYNISFLFDGTDYKLLSKAELEEKNEEVQRKAEDYDVDHLYVIDKEGNIYISLNEGYVGENLVTEGFVTREELDKILKNELFHLDVDENGNEYSEVVRENLVTKEYEGTRYVFNSCYVYGSNTDINDHYYAVTATRDTILDKAESILMDISLAFDTVVPYDAFAAFMIDQDSGKVIQASQEVAELKDKTVQELGLSDLSAYKDGEIHKIQIGDKKRLTVMRDYAADTGTAVRHYTIVAVHMGNSNLVNILWIIAVLFLASALILLTEAFIRQGSGKKEMRKRLSIMIVLLLLFNTAVISYIWVMANISDAMEQCRVDASATERVVEKNDELLEEVEEYYQDKKIAVLRALAGWVENYENEVMEDEAESTANIYYEKDKDGNRVVVKDPLGNPTVSFSNNVSLNSLKDEQEMNMLLILNQNGKTIASSGDGWYYELEGLANEEYIESLQMVLDKKTRGCCLMKSTEQGVNVEQIVAVPINLYVSSEDGRTVYHSRDEYEKDKEKKITCLSGLLVEDSNTDSGLVMTKELMGKVVVTSLGQYLDAQVAVATYDKDRETATLTYGSDEFDQNDLDTLQFTSQDFIDDNYKFSKYNGSSVFAGLVQLRTRKQYSLLTLLKQSDVLYGLWTVLLGSILAFLLYVLSVAMYFIHRENINPIETPQERQKKLLEKEREELRESHNLDHTQPRTRLFDVSDYVSTSASNRTALIAKTMISIFTTYVLIKLLISRAFDTASLSLTYALSERWTKGVHIFSVSVSLYLTLFLYVMNAAIRRFFSSVSVSLNSRLETMIRLMISILQYGSIIAVIGYSMYLFGVETGTVITSAGILTAIVGLGSQSLIGDVVSGLFIIIEREYMVGDVVTIDDFTGVVKEIGLRTTKLMDNCGSTKTFNNSQISGVLNLTENYSQCFITFEISQEVPVAVIEKLINEDLYQSMSGNEMIVEGPWFSGIMNMSGGCYTISIAARCLQADTWKVQKEMYAKTLQLFQEKGIISK